MTDSRLPGRWLIDPTMDGLSDRAWRTFTGSLMWSNEAGTDGAVPARQLRLVHPLGVDATTTQELVDAGLWSRTGDGIRVENWVENGQEFAAVVRAQREKARLRQQKHRQRVRSEVAPTPSVTRDDERDVGRDVGQDSDRTVTGTGQALMSPVVEDWETREIPDSGPPDSASDSWYQSAPGEWSEVGAP